MKSKLSLQKIPGLSKEQQWFGEARLGMFIHFGLYSLLARKSEWIMRHDLIPRETYARLARKFNPAHFSAEQWVATAQRAGARYITVTAKHHDGFCLWDSQLTDYKVTNTPFKRDLIGELIKACRRKNMRIILYYSIPDWHHAQYPHGSHGLDWPIKRKGDRPDASAYIAYLEGQIHELLTRYGRVDGLWWDGNVSSAFGGWTTEKMYRMLRKLHPQAVMNNRGGFIGDFSTPERTLPTHHQIASGRYFEANDSLGSKSWGYIKDEVYYSVERVLGNMIQVLAAGGNYLINVGPMPDGTIGAPFTERLARIGRWMKQNREAIDGTRPCPLSIGYWRNDSLESAGVVTRKQRSLYLLLKRWPDMDAVVLTGVRALPRGARLLGRQTERMTFRRVKQGLQIQGLPAAGADGLPVALKVSFRSDLRIDARFVKAALPRVIAIVPLKTAMLSAGNARVVGIHGASTPKLKFLTPTDTCFGWFHINQVVEWDIEVKAKGRYDVIVETGCPVGEDGSEYQVMLGGRCFTGKVSATGDYERFRPEWLGSVTLPPGPSVVVFQPTRQPHSSFGDFHRIVLRPVALKSG